MNTALLIMLLLILKHFVIDFPLQTPYQYLNKGTYGHPGGLLHSGLHAWGTFLVCMFFVQPHISLVVALIDFVIHYHTDWAKVNINKKFGWGPLTHSEFWTLLGLDQTVHLLTYVLITQIII